MMLEKNYLIVHMADKSLPDLHKHDQLNETISANKDSTRSEQLTCHLLQWYVIKATDNVSQE